MTTETPITPAARRYLARIGVRGGRAARGAAKSHRKMTAEQLAECRQLSATRDIRWLAARYGVAPITIKRAMKIEV